MFCAERVRRFEPRLRGLPGGLLDQPLYGGGQSAQKDRQPVSTAFRGVSSRNAKAVAWKHAEARYGQRRRPPSAQEAVSKVKDATGFSRVEIQLEPNLIAER